MYPKGAEMAPETDPETEPDVGCVLNEILPPGMMTALDRVDVLTWIGADMDIEFTLFGTSPRGVLKTIIDPELGTAPVMRKYPPVGMIMLLSAFVRVGLPR